MTTHHHNFDSPPDFQVSSRSAHALTLVGLPADHPIRQRVARAEEILADIDRKMRAETVIANAAMADRNIAKGTLETLDHEAAQARAEAIGRQQPEVDDPLAGAARDEALSRVRQFNDAYEASAARQQPLIKQRDAIFEVLHGAANLLRKARQHGENESSPGIAARLFGKNEIIKRAPALSLKRPSGGWIMLQQDALADVKEMERQLKLPVLQPLEAALREAERAVDVLAASAAPDIRAGHIKWPAVRRADIASARPDASDYITLIDAGAVACRYSRDQVVADLHAAIEARYANTDADAVVADVNQARLRRRDLGKRLALAQRTAAEATWAADRDGEVDIIWPRGIPAPAWFRVLPAA